MKKLTSIKIEEDILKKAHEFNINVSALTENAIKEKLNYKEIEIKDKCEFCGKDEAKASKETNYIGLTWLYPDEKWICDGCLNHKKRHVSIAQT